MKTGATLVEVLVAALVLVVASLPVMATIQTGSREANESEAMMFAEILASRAMERALARGYRALAADAPSTRVFEGPPDGSEVPAGLAAFDARWRGPLAFRTELRLSKPREALVGLEVVVSWGRVAGGGEHRYALARFLSQPGRSIELRYPIGESR